MECNRNFGGGGGKRVIKEKKGRWKGESSIPVPPPKGRQESRKSRLQKKAG